MRISACLDLGTYLLSINPPDILAFGMVHESSAAEVEVWVLGLRARIGAAQYGLLELSANHTANGAREIYD